MQVHPHLLNLSAYIDQNLEKDLPLSTLAKRVGLSPFHFHRKFGAYFGESLHQHIKRLRLERAAFALMHGSSPVRQIARESGYKTVSAFSHAFSGFAGESPTRYRSMASAGADAAGLDALLLEPAWVGEVPPLDFAFVRGTGAGSDVYRAVQEAMDVMVGLVGPFGDHVGNGTGASREASAADLETTAKTLLPCVAATTDIYGISRGGDFRVDVGVEADRLSAEQSALVGRLILPGGRYARFDLRCATDEVVSEARRISLRSLQSGGEAPRLSQYYARFAVPFEATTGGPLDFQLFVPLLG